MRRAGLSVQRLFEEDALSLVSLVQLHFSFFLVTILICGTVMFFIHCIL